MRLYDYQEIDTGYLADIMRKHGGGYLGWSRGLGKSLGSCALMDELDCKRVLVVAPNTSKKSVWEPELKRFCPWLEVVVLRNTRAQREKDLGYVKQLAEAGMDFALVVHYESLAIIGGERGDGWRRLFRGGFDMVVADEVHRIANPRAKMSKALKKIPTKYKLALSGTIIANSAEELFSPLQWLYPDVYRSKYRDWSDRYIDYVDGAFGRVCVGVKIEKIEEMRQELGVFLCCRTKEEELDLPARTEETRYVELSPRQRQAYDDLQDSCIAEIGSGEVLTAQDGLVLLGRLRQVATGLGLVSGELEDSSKLDLAVEMIQDNPDEAFVAFAWFKKSAHGLAKRLEAAGIAHYVITGDTKQEDRAKFIEEFQSGKGQVFIGTIKTLGESVNLVRANNVLTIDRSWNPGDNAQSLDRVFRIGQTKPVMVTHLVAKDTVDDMRVLPVLQDKIALRKLVLGERS